MTVITCSCLKKFVVKTGHNIACFVDGVPQRNGNDAEKTGESKLTSKFLRPRLCRAKLCKFEKWREGCFCNLKRADSKY